MDNLFITEKYASRRWFLREKISSGLILLPGNNEASINFVANTYPFRQDSNFLYFFGLDSHGLAGVIDVDSGEEFLFGPEFAIDDQIWEGTHEKITDRAVKIGIQKTYPFSRLTFFIKEALRTGRKIHYLPPYRSERSVWLSEIMEIPVSQIDASAELIRAVISLRTIKDEDEIREIEQTLEQITSVQHIAAMKYKKYGVKEVEIVALVENLGLRNSLRPAYPVICSVHGEILHNPFYDNIMQNGQMLLLDAGSESPMHYATDITRTIPVSGKFSPMQAEIYQLVYTMSQTALGAMKPGVPYSLVHKKAAATLVGGMIALGLMKGNAEEIVHEGAHALFFPHGLGHLLGLDVHDMEDLGEDNLGYDEEFKRSSQFGAASLRFGKKLTKGIIITVEPGVYFISALIDLWQKEKKFTQYINYNKLENYRGFGGIRIEDNVLITDNSNRILGNIIPKSLAEVEEACYHS